MLDLELNQQIARISGQYSGTRKTQICTTTKTSSPIAIGLFNPMILLPESLISELNEEELEQVLLHELSHIRRFDDWANLFQRVATALLFFHPAIWWINRQLNLDREIACDDFVLSIQNEKTRSYASSLIKVAQHALTPSEVSATGASMMTKTNIEKRIGLILNGKRSITTQIYRASLVLLFVVLSASIGILGQISPDIAISNSNRVDAHVLPHIAAEISVDNYLYWFNITGIQGPDLIQKIDLNSTRIQDVIELDRQDRLDLWLHPDAFKTGDRGKLFSTDQHLYWSDPSSNSIHRMSKSSAEEEFLVQATENITAFYVDEPRSLIYWAIGRQSSSKPAGAIYRSNIDGSNRQTVVQERGNITDIELDPRINMLYWTENEVFDQPRVQTTGFNNGSIYRLNFASGGIERKITSVGIITSLELDVEGGRLFWGQLSDPTLFSNLSPSMILTASLDGHNRTPIVALPQGPSLEQFSDKSKTWANGLGPFDLALDLEANKIYWSIRGSHLPAIPGRVQRSNLDGSELEDVVVGLENPYGIVLSNSNFEKTLPQAPEERTTNSGSRLFNQHNSNIYWLEGYTPRISRADFNGNMGEDLYTPHLSQSEFQSYSGCMYQSTDSVLSVSGNELVYSGLDEKLAIADFDTASFEFFNVEAHGHAQSDHIAIDQENRVIYRTRFSQSTSDTGNLIHHYEIYATDFQNSSDESLIYQGEGHGIGLTHDPINQMIYWSENHFAEKSGGHREYWTIFRKSDLDGANVKELFMITDSYIRQIRFDAVSQSIVAKNQNALVRYDIFGHSRKILNLDRCTGPKKFAIHRFELDLMNNKLYAVDTALGTIARMNIDGSGFEPVVQNLNMPVAIAIDNDLAAVRKQINSLSQRSPSFRGGGGSSP